MRLHGAFSDLAGGARSVSLEAGTVGEVLDALPARLPGLRELHIGHAIVSRAVFVGMREAVREMKRLITDAAR